jgi:protein SCO1/2
MRLVRGTAAKPPWCSAHLRLADASFGQIVNPLFITCDPARDTLAATATYVSEFHPRLMGLTGSYEAVKQACKAYRVYFSTPPGADPSGDYLVDHSIFFYLMDPGASFAALCRALLMPSSRAEGKFVDAFGRSQSADDVTGKVHGFVESWKKAGHPLGNADAKARITADSSRRVP